MLLAGLLGIFGCYDKFQGEVETKEEATKRAEDAIKNDATLKELDNLCKELPVLQDFSLDHKCTTKHRKSVGFVYRPQTERRINFAGEALGYDWVEFSKDKKYILIAIAPGNKKTYAISCADSSFSMAE